LAQAACVRGPMFHGPGRRSQLITEPGRFLSRPSAVAQRGPLGGLATPFAQPRAQTAPGGSRSGLVDTGTSDLLWDTGPALSASREPAAFRPPPPPVSPPRPRRAQSAAAREAEIREVRELPEMREVREDPLTLQANDDEVQAALDRLTRVIHATKSAEFDAAWSEVQHRLAEISAQVEKAQAGQSEVGKKLRDAQLHEKKVLAPESAAQTLEVVGLNAVERLRRREEQEKLKSNAKRAVIQLEREYAKWKAELDRKRTDLTATRATSRNAQVQRASLIAQRVLDGAAVDEPDGRTLRTFVNELQAIGDEKVMERLDAAAPQLEPWMRKAVAVYATLEREVKDLQATAHDVVTRRGNLDITDCVDPREALDHHATRLIEGAVLKTAGVHHLSTGTTNVAQVHANVQHGSGGSPSRGTRAEELLRPTAPTSGELEQLEGYLSGLHSKVGARQEEMQKMRKNFSTILQYRLVHGEPTGGLSGLTKSAHTASSLTFEEAEKLLATLSTKDYARTELKSLQRAVMAARPHEDLRKTFHVSVDHLRQIRDPLGYVKQSKQMAATIQHGDGRSWSRAGTPSGGSRPQSRGPESPLRTRGASIGW